MKTGIGGSESQEILGLTQSFIADKFVDLKKNLQTLFDEHKKSGKVVTAKRVQDFFKDLTDDQNKSDEKEKK